MSEASHQKTNVLELAQDIKASKLRAIAKALTLVESEHEEDRAVSTELIKAIYSKDRRSRRIAISGVPGVGKSSLIEEYGTLLVNQGRKVAVLAVDPSSPLTGGSILGDKTRMEKLSASPNAFVRPSPNRGTLGGITRSTREACLIFEAAGYDDILIETVGVGQSETVAYNVVDCFIMLHLPNSGDELQGIKKGITELADIIVIHKADKNHLAMARAAKSEHLRAASFYKKNVPIVLVSSMEKVGLEDFESTVKDYFADHKGEDAEWQAKRRTQYTKWFKEEVSTQLLDFFTHHSHFEAIYASALEEARTFEKAPPHLASEFIKDVKNFLK